MFTKLRLRQGGGFHEFLVMTFGVTNAPAQFTNMMDDLLGELPRLIRLGFP